MSKHGNYLQYNNGHHHAVMHLSMKWTAYGEPGTKKTKRSQHDNNNPYNPEIMDRQQGQQLVALNIGHYTDP